MRTEHIGERSDPCTKSLELSFGESSETVGWFLGTLPLEKGVGALGGGICSIAVGLRVNWDGRMLRDVGMCC